MGVRKELNECREEISRARADNSMYMQSEVKYKLEVDKLTAMFEQLKCTEQSLLDRTETHSREMEVLSHKLEEALQKVRQSVVSVCVCMYVCMYVKFTHTHIQLFIVFIYAKTKDGFSLFHLGGVDKSWGGGGVIFP